MAIPSLNSSNRRKHENMQGSIAKLTRPLVQEFRASGKTTVRAN